MPGPDLGGSPPNTQPFSAGTLRCIALLACGVSLALTLRFCLGLRTDDDIAATALAGAMAVCWESGKLAFATAGAARLRCRSPGQFAGGVCLSLISLALLAGSVGASLSYLQQHAGELRNRTLTQSRRYRDIETRLQGLNSELATLRETAAQDAAHGYRARALRTISTARQLAGRRDEVAAQRTALADAGVHAVSASVLQPLADAVGMDALRLQLLAHFAIALLLEAIALASLLLLKLPATAAPHAMLTTPTPAAPLQVGDVDVHPHPASDAFHHAVVAQSAAAAVRCTVAGQPDADAYARCRDLIIDGSIRPSLRSVQEAINIGQRKAQRFLLALCREGVLTKTENGRGFRTLVDFA